MTEWHVNFSISCISFAVNFTRFNYWILKTKVFSLLRHLNCWLVFDSSARMALIWLFDFMLFFRELTSQWSWPRQYVAHTTENPFHISLVMFLCDMWTNVFFTYSCPICNSSPVHSSAKSISVDSFWKEIRNALDSFQTSKRWLFHRLPHNMWRYSVSAVFRHVLMVAVQIIFVSLKRQAVKTYSFVYGLFIFVVIMHCPLSTTAVLNWIEKLNRSNFFPWIWWH